MMEKQANAGLKDIFSTILKDHDLGHKVPQIVVLQGSGHVFAPGGTVHVWGSRPPPTTQEEQE